MLRSFVEPTLGCATYTVKQVEYARNYALRGALCLTGSSEGSRSAMLSSSFKRFRSAARSFRLLSPVRDGPPDFVGVSAAETSLPAAAAAATVAAPLKTSLRACRRDTLWSSRGVRRVAPPHILWSSFLSTLIGLPRKWLPRMLNVCTPVICKQAMIARRTILALSMQLRSG